MSYEDILETSEDGQFRVKLVADEDAEEPYDEGQSPLIRLDYRGGYWHAEHIMVSGSRPTGNDTRIEEAATRFGSSRSQELFEKYLRAYHGASQIEWWSSQDYVYVTYDTAEWRAWAGFEDGDLPPAGAINLNEYRAWCEGDVWGWVIEKRVHWNATTDDPDFEDRESDVWEREDDCWGYYGYDYAKETALEELASHVAEHQAKDREGDPPMRPGIAYRLISDTMPVELRGEAVDEAFRVLYDLAERALTAGEMTLHMATRGQVEELAYGVTRPMLDELAGRPVTDEEFARLRKALEFSTISECVRSAVEQVTGLADEDEED